MNKGKYIIGRLMSIVAMSVALSAMFPSCIGDGGETIPLEYTTKPASDIPSDEEATANPVVNPNSTLPNFGNVVTEGNDGDMIAELYMLGLKYPEADKWLYLVGTGGKGDIAQNVWVSVDGTPKGCVALNNSVGEVKKPISMDFVFLVDNSGNMNEAGDNVARDLTSWASELKNANLDMRYGCVGYSRVESALAEVGVNGAKDICTVSDLNDYLTRGSRVGVMRTKGYIESESSLQILSSEKYSNCRGACPVEALRFADEAFSFRESACRVYLNFIDEANQPSGMTSWSVNYVNDPSVWQAYKGSIHTVYNGVKNFTEEPLQYEWPWRLSTYTGGTVEFDYDRTLTNMYLNKLTVTGVMKHSYIIRFKNIAAYMDGNTHNVRVTVRSADGKVQADRNFYVTFKKK